MLHKEGEEWGSLFRDNTIKRLGGGVGAQAEQGPVVIVAAEWRRERHLQTVILMSKSDLSRPCISICRSVCSVL